jgi:hypothetical protein
MELIQNVADYGDAPSFIATNVTRVFLISPNIVRVTFARTDRRHDGAEELRVSGHVDMDVHQMVAMNAIIRDALPQVLAETSGGLAEFRQAHTIAAH